MAVDSYGTRNQPNFDENAPINDAAEKNAISEYAAFGGNRANGLHASRLAYAAPWNGLDWWETDQGWTYRYYISGGVGAWHVWEIPPTVFVPSWSSGFTVGNANQYGIYSLAGGFNLAVEVDVVLGSTSAVTGSPVLTLPNGFSFNTVAGGFRFPVGHSVYYDASVPLDLYGTATIASATTAALRPYVVNSGATHETVDANVASLLPWTSGDQIQAHIRALVA